MLNLLSSNIIERNNAIAELLTISTGQAIMLSAIALGIFLRLPANLQFLSTFAIAAFLFLRIA